MKAQQHQAHHFCLWRGSRRCRCSATLAWTLCCQASAQLPPAPAPTAPRPPWSPRSAWRSGRGREEGNDRNNVTKATWCRGEHLQTSHRTSWQLTGKVNRTDYIFIMASVSGREVSERGNILSLKLMLEAGIVFKRKDLGAFDRTGSAPVGCSWSAGVSDPR